MQVPEDITYENLRKLVAKKWPQVTSKNFRLEYFCAEMGDGDECWVEIIRTDGFDEECADEENPLHRALHVDPCLTDAFTMFDEMASATMHTFKIRVALVDDRGRLLPPSSAVTGNANRRENCKRKRGTNSVSTGPQSEDTHEGESAGANATVTSVAARKATHQELTHKALLGEYSDHPTSAPAADALLGKMDPPAMASFMFMKWMLFHVLHDDQVQPCDRFACDFVISPCKIGCVFKNALGQACGHVASVGAAGVPTNWVRHIQDKHGSRFTYGKSVGLNDITVMAAENIVTRYEDFKSNRGAFTAPPPTLDVLANPATFCTERTDFIKPTASIIQREALLPPSTFHYGKWQDIISGDHMANASGVVFTFLKSNNSTRFLKYLHGKPPNAFQNPSRRESISSPMVGGSGGNHSDSAGEFSNTSHGDYREYGPYPQSH